MVETDRVVLTSPHPRLIVREPNAAPCAPSADAECISLVEFRRLVRSGAYFKRLRHYGEVELHLYSLDTYGRIWPYALVLPPLSRGKTTIIDSEGGRLRVGPRLTMRLLYESVRDRVVAASLTPKTNRWLDQVTHSPEVRTYDASGSALYLRTDFWFGLAAGGSVGHVAGVINNLGDFGGAPILFTTDPIPTVADAVEIHVVRPGGRFRNLGELRMVAFNYILTPRVWALLGARRPGFIYQRSSAFNFSGLALAVRYSVPMVLEYNSSRVWTGRHWGERLRHEALAERIEQANLQGADLVVVVSAALLDQLVSKGVSKDKILVNPNGVDAGVYAPDVDGEPMRRRLGLEGKTVVGFIGTFGRWHGAEVLADAYGHLMHEHPELRESVRLLLMGDGVTMPDVVGSLRRHGVLELAVVTGLVPQAEGPSYLAACDVLVSPHVPNPDGTPFFGSPTKLFEYMAMGKGIVASDLDQIAAVLEHEWTAILVPPGDAKALAVGLERLIRDSDLRTRIGAAARRRAVERHTWREHTRRIIEALAALFPSDSEEHAERAEGGDRTNRVDSAEVCE